MVSQYLVRAPPARTVEPPHRLGTVTRYRVRMDTSTTSLGAGRPNTDLAAVVDQALALAEKQGARAAAAFLTARGAGFALTCRVLTEPERRRQRALAVYSADAGTSSPYSRMR